MNKDLKTPKTRKQLVTWLWNNGIYCNVFKEGPVYAIQYGRIIAATGIRCIDSLSFHEWAVKCNSEISIAEYMMSPEYLMLPYND